MGVGKRRNASKLAKLTVASAIVALPFASATSYAEARTVSDSSFENQYQVNANQEISLLKVAQSYRYKNSQTTYLQNQVYAINQEISLLYRLRQFLIQQSNTRAPRVDGQTSQQITEALNQLAQKWHINVSGRDGEDHQEHGNKKEKSRTGQNLKHDVRPQFLAQIDAAILQLQQLAIRDLQQWIKIEMSQSTPTPLPAVGLTISPGAATVNVGAVLNYSVQILDNGGRPIARSGVKVDFALPAPNNDGTLTITSGYTDVSGRISVAVVAGSTPGTLQLGAWIDGSSNSYVYTSVTKVVNPNSVTTHLALSGGTLPTMILKGQSVGGSSYTITPLNAYNQLVAGDTLRVTTSNSSVLSLQAPDVVGGNQQTLQAGNYTLPIMTGQSYGSSTVTITDLSAPGTPSLSYSVAVVAAQPTRIVAINPLGTQSSYYVSSAGLVGPFTIATVDAYGNVVPATESIELSASQVNQIIGSGTGVRLTPTGADVSTVVLPKGQTGIAVYVDNASVGNTSPAGLSLGNIVPSIKTVVVKDSRTIEITYNQALDETKVPSVADYVVGWGTGTSTPQSVKVTGSVVTLTLWGAPLSHATTVTVSYNPGNDSSSIRTVWGVNAGNVTSLSAYNPL